MDQRIDSLTAQALTRFLQVLKSRYPIEQAILYGSRARGTYSSDSDADLALILSGQPGRILDTKMAMSDLAYDIFLETGIDISPLPIWQEQWQHPESFSNPYLLENIAQEGIRL